MDFGSHSAAEVGASDRSRTSQAPNRTNVHRGGRAERCWLLQVTGVDFIGGLQAAERHLFFSNQLHDTHASPTHPCMFPGSVCLLVAEFCKKLQMYQHQETAICRQRGAGYGTPALRIKIIVPPA